MSNSIKFNSGRGSLEDSRLRLLPRWVGRFQAISGWGLAVGFLFVVGACTLIWQVSARGDDPEAAVKAAMAETVEMILTDPACPTDPARVQQTADVMFWILHPGLAGRNRWADPEFRRQAEITAAQFLNPEAFQSRRFDDPEFRREYEAAIAEMETAAKSSSEAEFSVVPPSSKGLKDMEPLLNDREWVRQRQEPIERMVGEYRSKNSLP